MKDNHNDTKSEPCWQDRGSCGSQQQNHDSYPKFTTNSSDRPLSNRRDTCRPRIGTIDRALGIHSDEEETDENPDDTAATPSLLHRLGLRRNREDCTRKSSRL